MYIVHTATAPYNCYCIPIVHLTGVHCHTCLQPCTHLRDKIHVCMPARDSLCFVEKLYSDLRDRYSYFKYIAQPTHVHIF